MARPDFEQVLDAIYEAAVDPQLWSHALESLSDRFWDKFLITPLGVRMRKPPDQNGCDTGAALVL